MGFAFLVVPEKKRDPAYDATRKSLRIEIEARTLAIDFWNNAGTYHIALRAAWVRDWYIS